MSATPCALELTRCAGGARADWVSREAVICNLIEFGPFLGWDDLAFLVLDVDPRSDRQIRRWMRAIVWSLVRGGYPLRVRPEGVTWMASRRLPGPAWLKTFRSVRARGHARFNISTGE